MSQQFIYPEPTEIAFDKIGHTGKFFGTNTPLASHMIVETTQSLTVSLLEHKSQYNYYVLEGSGQFIINAEAHPCKPGDLIVIPPGNIFTWEGRLKLLSIITPQWTPEQEEELPKQMIQPDKPHA